MIIPRQGPDSIRVADHRSETATVLGIPDLNQAFPSANGDMGSLEDTG